MPKVSVIIPTYNCAKYITEALDSVLNQTYQDFEIVIVDDGSTDNTKEVLKPYLEKYTGKIKYIYQQNQGHSVARNTAIKNSQGEYIAILDADDLWLPNRLAKEVLILENNPDIGLIHANIGFLSDKDKKIVIPKRKVKFLSGYIFKYLFLRQANVAMATVLVRKKCFNIVGLFDENMTRMGAEDREMWLRVSEKFRLQYIDEVLAYYRVRDNSESKNLEKMLAGRIYIVNKFCPEGKKQFLLLRKQAMAKIHRDLGDQYLLNKDYINAKKEYNKSLSYFPFSFWLLINFIKSYIKK